MTEPKVRRIIALGQREAALMRNLAEVQAERCRLLQELLAKHGPDAGMPGDITTLAAEPKR